MRRTSVLTVLLLLAMALPATAGPPTVFPDTIPLPDGYFPEGIATDGPTAYVGSLVDGAVVAQDLRTGDTTPFAPSPGRDRIAVGLDVDADGRLWVAGGGPVLSPTVASSFRVHDGDGTLLLEQPLPAAGFVNDVVVTEDAAWFTDSFLPQLIRVPIADDGTIGAPAYVALAGDWEQAPGFNANGIVATGDSLVVAQATAPEGGGAALHRVPADASAASLDTTRIELDGALPGADGLVLIGRTLYVVAGPPGVVELRLSGDLDAATVARVLEVPGSVTPTTAAEFGSRLYVVDAKFPFFGDPTTPFVTTAIDR